MEPRKYLIITLISVGFLLLIMVIQPAITSQMIYTKQKEQAGPAVEDVDKLKAEMVVLNQSLDTCFETSKKTSVESEECMQRRVEYEAKFQEAQNNYERCNSNLNSRDSELNEKKNDYESVLNEKEQCAEDKVKIGEENTNLKLNYDQLLKNSAKTICCKQKVDNPNINSYKVEENKIVCLESGENTLTCF